VGRRAYKYGAPAGCAGGLFQGFRRIGGATNVALDSPWHPSEAMPIPHTTTRALPTPMPTATVHTRTVRGRPRAAGAERFLGMLPSVSQAFLPSKTPNFGQISLVRALTTKYAYVSLIGVRFFNTQSARKGYVNRCVVGGVAIFQDSRVRTLASGLHPPFWASSR
jgi:hypothetical protein